MTWQVHGFQWDKGNRSKCQQHGVSVAEIEGLFTRVLHVFPDLEHSHAEERHLAIGQAADGRHVFLAFTLRDQDSQRLIRPISARYMHTKEVRHYEAQIAKLDQ